MFDRITQLEAILEAITLALDELTIVSCKWKSDRLDESLQHPFSHALQAHNELESMIADEIARIIPTEQRITDN